MIGLGSDCLQPVYISLPSEVKGTPFSFLRVRCGKCPNCRKFQSLEWSLRCLMEYQGMIEKRACFVTLTYDDEHLKTRFFNDGEKTVEIPTLDFDDLKKCFYKIRSYYKIQFRYFAVGEYGTFSDRSHFHIIFFGLNKNDGVQDIFENCWIHGFVQVEDFSPVTAFYTAGYVQKKLYSNKDFFMRVPEQSRCSLGLGWKWFLNEWHSGHCVGKDGQPCVHYNGFEYGVPRSFIRKLVDIGEIDKQDMFQFAFKQWLDYNHLVRDLSQKGLTIEEFFKYRKKLAYDKLKNKFNDRDKI